MLKSESVSNGWFLLISFVLYLYTLSLCIPLTVRLFSCCFENTPTTAVTVELLLKWTHTHWNMSQSIQLTATPKLPQLQSKSPFHVALLLFVFFNLCAVFPYLKRWRCINMQAQWCDACHHQADSYERSKSLVLATWWIIKNSDPLNLWIFSMSKLHLIYNHQNGFIFLIVLTLAACGSPRSKPRICSWLRASRCCTSWCTVKRVSTESWISGSRHARIQRSVPYEQSSSLWLWLTGAQSARLLFPQGKFQLDFTFLWTQNKSAKWLPWLLLGITQDVFHCAYYFLFREKVQAETLN